MNPKPPLLKLCLREHGAKQIVEVLTAEGEPLGRIPVTKATYVLTPRAPGRLSIEVLVAQAAIEGST